MLLCSIVIQVVYFMLKIVEDYGPLVKCIIHTSANIASLKCLWKSTYVFKECVGLISG